LIFEAIGFKNTKILIPIYIVFFKLCLFFSLAPSLLFMNLGDEKQEINLLWPYCQAEVFCSGIYANCGAIAVIASTTYTTVVNTPPHSPLR